MASKFETLRKIARIRWERPTSDKNVAKKLGITINDIESLTADADLYEMAISKELGSRMYDTDESNKFRRYIRSVENRGGNVNQAFSKKMKIFETGDNNVDIELLIWGISCYL